MDPHDPRWRQHLDIITAWGEASAANQTPLPTDEELWSVARLRADLQLPETIDEDLLDDVRDAFNEGRQPTRINLQAVADDVNARGIPARVVRERGYTATLYTGDATTDGYGVARYSAAAGPGWFAGPSGLAGPHGGAPFADTSDWQLGPHDNSWMIGVAQHASTTQIADRVAAVTAYADAQIHRFDTAVASARDAMWEALQTAYPDAKRRGLPDGFDNTAVVELRLLLARWLDAYWPAAHTVPPHLTGSNPVDGDLDGSP